MGHSVKALKSFYDSYMLKGYGLRSSRMYKSTSVYQKVLRITLGILSLLIVPLIQVKEKDFRDHEALNLQN